MQFEKWITYYIDKTDYSLIIKVSPAVHVIVSLWVLSAAHFVLISTETVWLKRFYWQSLSDLAWPWRWRANSFAKTESLLHRCVCVGCQLNSDQALRLLCLKGHVRARGSMLWRHQWTTSEWILVYSNTSLRESSNQNKCPKTREKLSPTRNQCHVVKFSRMAPQNQNRGFLETAFHAVLINYRIDLGPNILKSCFLHWTGVLQGHGV